MIPSKKKKVHQRVHHYTLSTTEKGTKESGEKTGKEGVRITGSGGKKAQDSSKAERNGDSGRQIEKSKKRIEELEERLRNATSKKERQKIWNIERTVERSKKGETHHRR